MAIDSLTASNWRRDDAMKALEEALVDLKREFSPLEIQQLQNRVEYWKDQASHFQHLVNRWAEEAMKYGSPGLT